MFKVREKLITRDIAGIFFIIDIADKYCYDVKKIYSVNNIGKVLFDIMLDNQIFNSEIITNQLIGILTNYSIEQYGKIKSDVEKFINQLVNVGYILEVENDIR